MKKFIAPLLALVGSLAAAPALCDSTGVSPTEIKLGQTTSYSGPASQFGQIGRVQSAFFRMLNERGGINGRKINLISLDDAYSPPKSVEQVRRLVESDEIAFMFNSFGGPTNAAQAKYLNSRKIPQLFVATGAHYWGDVQQYPWSMGWQPSFRVEAQIYAKDALLKAPNAKIAILYQNDDFGKDYLLGIKDIIAKQTQARIVSEISYATTEPTIDSQAVNLRASEADVVILAAVPKYAAQFLRKMIELNWNPHVYIALGASGVSTTTEPARDRTDLKLYTGAFFKDWNAPAWKDDPEVKDFLSFMKAYAPDLAAADFAAVYGYSVAQTVVSVLERCGDDLSRENIMRKAASISDLALPLLIPSIRITTTPDDHYPVEQLQLARWSGQSWVSAGPIIDVK